MSNRRRTASVCQWAALACALVGCHGRVESPAIVPVCTGTALVSPPESARAVIQVSPEFTLRSFPGDAGRTYVEQYAFSPDGLLAYEGDGFIQIWDVDRRLLLSQFASRAGGDSIAFSASDRLVIDDLDFDSETNPEYRLDGHQVGTVDFDHLVGDTFEGGVLVHRALDGNRLRAQRAGGPERVVELTAADAASAPTLNVTTVSRDGSMLVTMIDDDLLLWRFSGDRVRDTRRIHLPGAQRLTALADGAGVLADAWTPDGMAIVRIDGDDGTVTRIAPYPDDDTFPPVLSPDGRWLATVSADAITVRETDGVRTWRLPRRPGDDVSSVIFDPDARSLLVTSTVVNGEGRVVTTDLFQTVVLDVDTGQPSGRLGASIETPLAVGWSSEQTLDVVTGRRRITWDLAHATAETTEPALSDARRDELTARYPWATDERALVSRATLPVIGSDGTEHDTCAVSSGASDPVALEGIDEDCWAATRIAAWGEIGDHVVRLAPSAAGGTDVGVWRSDGTQALWTSLAGDEATDGDLDGTEYAHGTRILIAVGFRVLDIDLAAGTASVIGDGNLMVGDTVEAPDQSVIATWHDGTLTRIDADGVISHASSEGGPQDVMAFSPDGSRFATQGSDGAVRLWRTAPLTLVATLVAFQDDEHLIYTPDGFYDGTPDAPDRIAWVFDEPTEGFRFEQFAADAARVEQVVARLAGTPAASGAVTRRPPRVAIVDADTQGATARIHLHASSIARVDQVRFFVDGSPAGGAPVCAATGDPVGEVPLHAGANRVTAVAYDDAGLSSNLATLEVAGPKASRVPVLWVVAVGISHYPHLASNEQLEVADDDARAIADALEEQVDRGAFAKGPVVRLIDTGVTEGRVLGALRDLRAMAPDDLAVVFFAGHGLALSDDAETTFLTADARDDDLGRGGIRWSEVAQALSGVRGRVLVLLDACHAGHFSREVVVPNANLASALAGAGRAGVLVFSASKGNQLSYEPSTTRAIAIRGDRDDGDHTVAVRRPPALAKGHGLFTAALLEALQSSTTDRDGDGAIEVSEWIDVVTERVRDVTGDVQIPWVARREVQGDFVVAQTSARNL